MDGWCDTLLYKLVNRARCGICDNPTLCWRTVTHALCLLHHGYVGAYTCSLDIEHHENPIFVNMYKYKIAFLSAWNMMFQGIFLCLSLTYDMMEWRNSHRCAGAARVLYWRDVLYGGLVVPFTLFVSAIFWGVYLVDRQLIFPTVYEEMIPWWLQFCVHTSILVVLVLETLLQERSAPANRSLELFLSSFFANGYAVVIYGIYLIHGVWLYEFFKVMSLWQICLYQLVCSSSSYVFYVIQHPINRLVHGRRREDQDKVD